MNSRIGNASRLLLFSVGVIIVICGLGGDSYSQRVRLRGNVDPECERWGRNRPRWKFSDIGGDGNVADKPLTGDYDGEGKADFTVWRPSDGNWYILPSSASNPIYVNFGLVNVDKPLSGDFDGDGKFDVAVYRPTTGFWYLLNSSNGSFAGVKFGLPGEDTAVPADYDGDGKTDIAVFRPDGRAWYRLNSSNGAFVVRNFGQPGDTPSPTSVNPE